jgi:hypothetical protein
VGQPWSISDLWESPKDVFSVEEADDVNLLRRNFYTDTIIAEPDAIIGIITLEFSKISSFREGRCGFQFLNQDGEALFNSGKVTDALQVCAEMFGIDYIHCR